MIEFRNQMWEDVRSVPRDRWDRTSVAESMAEASDPVTVMVVDDAAGAVTKLQ